MGFSLSRYYLTFGIPVLIICYLVWGLMDDFDAQDREQVPVGKIASLSTETHWYGDTTVLTLENGTQVTLSGTFNPWKPGQTVTQPAPRTDGKIDTVKNYWCVGGNCLKQK